MRPSPRPPAVPQPSWRIERAERSDASTAVLSLSGDLDLDAVDPATAVLSRLEDREPRLVVIDLHEVAFMDVFGARLLARAQERADVGGWTLVVVAPAPPADRVLHLLAIGARINLTRRTPGGSGSPLPAFGLGRSG